VAEKRNGNAAVWLTSFSCWDWNAAAAVARDDENDKDDEGQHLKQMPVEWKEAACSVVAGFGQLLEVWRPPQPLQLFSRLHSVHRTARKHSCAVYTSQLGHLQCGVVSLVVCILSYLFIYLFIMNKQIKTNA